MLENKQLFYQNYDKNAPGFRSVFEVLLNDYTDLLKKHQSFQKNK